MYSHLLWAPLCIPALPQSTITGTISDPAGSLISQARIHHETDIVLELARTQRQDIRLQVGAVTDSITVASAPPPHQYRRRSH